MTTYFHIRVSTDLFVDSHIATGSTHAGGMSTTFNPKFKEFCIAHFNKYIMALENADADEKRTHIHIHGESVLHGNSQSMRRAWLKANLPTGRGSYTLKSHDNTVKPPDYNGYIYVCKGPETFVKTPPEIMGKEGFTDDDIIELHEEYWRNNKIYQKSLQPESIKVDLSELPVVKKRKKTITWTQQMIYDIDACYPDKTWSNCLKADKEKLCDLILDNMAQGGKALDKTVFRRIYNAVYNGVRKTNQDRAVFRQGFYDCIEEM